MIDVEAVHRARGLALLTDGRVASITDWIDAEGDETEDRDAAVLAVVKLAEDDWRLIDLRDFETVRPQ